MFLKEKCDGTINAHGCANGRPQWEYTTKDKVSSPMVSLEAMMLSCAVIVTEIPGAFLHADMAAQGIHVPLTRIYQENKRTILLSENGRTSCSKCTKHLNVWCFFVTDQIKLREVKVPYCPTENMMADSLPSHFKEQHSKNVRTHT